MRAFLCTLWALNPHLSRFSQHPLFQLALAFAGGICASNFLSFNFPVVLGACVICAAASFVALLKRRTSVAGMFLLAAFFFTGQIVFLLERQNKSSFVSEDIVGRTLLLTGVLDGPPEFARTRIYLSLRVERLLIADTETNISGRVWLLAPIRTPANADQFKSLQLRYGTRISVTTSLDYSGNYRNPGVSTLSEYLESRDYDATGIIRSPASIYRIEDTNVFKPLASLYAWRQRLQRAIDSHFNAETSGVLDAA